MGRTRPWLVAAVAAAAIGCSSDSTGSSGDNGNNGGGPVGQIIVGNDFFQSAHNGTKAAQDTVPAGQTVVWTWTGTGATLDSVVSDGPATFPGSGDPQFRSYDYDSRGHRQGQAKWTGSGSPSYKSYAFDANGSVEKSSSGKDR